MSGVLTEVCNIGCFSADVRKITMDENPGRQFGEISRIVADRWRQMSDADKQVGRWVIITRSC